MNTRFKKMLGILVLVVGIVGIVGSFTIGYIGERNNKNVMNDFQWEQLLQEPIYDFKQHAKKPVQSSKEEQPSKKPVKKEENLFRENAMAIISIPKVNIKYPVVKGTDAKTLKYSLGYFEGTALPGEIGNFSVAGHRNSSYARYFNRLDEVKIGDEIIVETRNETYTYIVDKTFKIHENDVDVLNPSKDKRITLITCTNGFKPKYRIVVQGVIK